MWGQLFENSSRGVDLLDRKLHNTPHEIHQDPERGSPQDLLPPPVANDQARVLQLKHLLSILRGLGDCESADRIVRRIEESTKRKGVRYG